MGILEEITPVDFRNLENAAITTVPGINLILGANGQGKTNLIEAIHFICYLRSFRGSGTQNLSRWQRDNFALHARFNDRGISQQVSIKFGQTTQLTIAGAAVGRASDYINNFLSVAFVPQDLRVVQGTGVDRRRFIDLITALIHPEYIFLLNDYSHSLKSRNILLRQYPPDNESLTAFDGLLTRKSAAIALRRYQVCQQINRQLAETDYRIVDHHRIILDYQFSCAAEIKKINEDHLAIAYARTLKDNEDSDRRNGYTQSGPQREDFAIVMDDVSLRFYGSQGQCRLAMLALKFAIGQLLVNSKNRECIIYLVDDVLNELDARRQEIFLEILRLAPQAFVTCTDRHWIERLQPAAVFSVEDGSFQRE